MKKIVLLSIIILFTTACTNINKIDYKDNINEIIKNNYNKKLSNHVGIGYKYYLPKYMSIKNISNYNEVLNSNDYTYYLYIDIISYYNKNNIITEECNNKYEFSYKKNSGYMCINDVNNQYLVEIVYNYAKIEVIVDKNNLNEVVNNSIIILSTIKYDKELISNIIIENKMQNNEETLNIFDNNNKKKDFIEVIEEYDSYDKKEDIPDYDIIN